MGLTEHSDGLMHRQYMSRDIRRATDLGTDSLDGVNQNERAITQSRGGGDLAREVDVSRGVDQVDAVLLEYRVAAWTGSDREISGGERTVEGPGRDPPAQTDGGGLHGDAALLLVLAAVEVADCAGESSRNDPVRGEERVCKGRLAMAAGASAAFAAQGERTRRARRCKDCAYASWARWTGLPPSHTRAAERDGRSIGEGAGGAQVTTVSFGALPLQLSPRHPSPRPHRRPLARRRRQNGSRPISSARGDAEDVQLYVARGSLVSAPRVAERVS